MRKIFSILIIFAVLVSATILHAAMPTEDDYKNLDELRAKLVRMKKEMDRFMKDIMANSPGLENRLSEYYGQDVRVDVSEDGKNIVVRADLLGMEKDKIDIALENNRFLRIKGLRESLKKETAQGVVKQERMTGKFERVLELPQECKDEGIKATYKNGVLEVIIPKMAEDRTATVKVNIQ